jgi:MFS family permease
MLPASESRAPTRVLWNTVYATAFFALSLEGVVGLVLPLLLIQLEAPPQVLGLVVALGALGPLLLSIPAGVLCDRYGDRTVLLFCAAGSLVTCLLYPLSSLFWVLALVQIFGGTTRSIGWLASQSYVARFAAGGERSRRMGYFTFSANLGMLVTPPLIGFVINRTDAQTGFVFLAIWAVALLLVTHRLPSRASAIAKKGPIGLRGLFIDPYRGATSMALRPAVAVVLLGTFLRLSTISLAQSFYPVYLVTLGYSAATIGLLFSLMFLASTLTAPLYGWITRYINGGQMIWVSAALSIAGICLMPLAHSMPAICLFTVIHGVGIGFSLPSLMSEISGRTGLSERGLATALRSLFNRLGYLVTPILLGWSVAEFGLNESFFGAGVIMGCLMLSGIVFDRARNTAS